MQRQQAWPRSPNALVPPSTQRHNPVLQPWARRRASCWSESQESSESMWRSSESATCGRARGLRPAARRRSSPVPRHRPPHCRTQAWRCHCRYQAFLLGCCGLQGAARLTAAPVRLPCVKRCGPALPPAARPPARQSPWEPTSVLVLLTAPDGPCYRCFTATQPATTAAGSAQPSRRREPASQQAEAAPLASSFEIAGRSRGPLAAPQRSNNG